MRQNRPRLNCRGLSYSILNVALDRAHIQAAKLRSFEVCHRSLSFLQSLRAGRERARVLNGLKGGALRIGVALRRSVLRVANREHDIDVRQASGEYPILLIQTARVQHLDDRLDVTGAEKGEVAGVGG